MNEKSSIAPVASEGHQDVGKSASGSASVVSETVGERLKRVYLEHYVRIIIEMNRTRGAEPTALALGVRAGNAELQCAFRWDITPEGHSFWAKLSDRERSDG